jgi:hypothetical protein
MANSEYGTVEERERGALISILLLVRERRIRRLVPNLIGKSFGYT